MLRYEVLTARKRYGNQLFELLLQYKYVKKLIGKSKHNIRSKENKNKHDYLTIA